MRIVCVCEIGKDAGRENRVVGLRRRHQIRLAAGELKRIGEYLLRNINEGGGIVRAADRDACTRHEIEIRARAAADLKDAASGGKSQ